MGEKGKPRSRPRPLRAVVAVVALVALSLLGVAARGSVAGPIRWDGQDLRDGLGRIVTLHGLNVVLKTPPYLPDGNGTAITATSLNDADAAQIASWGFTVVRLGLLWQAVEPVRGQIDLDYLDRAKSIIQTLNAHGIATIVDFHQDVWSQRYAGEGAPKWATTSPLPATNSGNWGANYFTPAVMDEFDRFWANVGGIRDEYVAAWSQVAAVLANGADGLLGYDVFNEPWPGTQWATCATPQGCPAFEKLFLQPFYQQVINAIRAEDPQHLIVVAPPLPANYGAGVTIGPFTDPGPSYRGAPQIALGFHDYCLEGSLDGSFSGQGASCAPLEKMAAETQTAHAAAIGAAPLVTEFGASNDLTDIARVIEDVETAGTRSWIYWSYKQTGDPTGSPTESVLDPETLAPSMEKLRVVARPYAASIAGEGASQWWDAGSQTLAVTYSSWPAGGSSVIAWSKALFGPAVVTIEALETNGSGCDAVGDPAAITVTCAAGGAVRITARTR